MRVDDGLVNPANGCVSIGALLAVVVICCIGFLLYMPSSGSAEEGAPPARRTEDELLTLFIPRFSFKEMKAAEFGGGKVHLTIVADETLTPKKMRTFTDTLLSRGVNVSGPVFFGDFSMERTADKAALTMTRRVAGLPDVVEVSESVVMDPSGSRPVVALTVSDGIVHLLLKRDLGRSWEKVVIFPDPEPRTTESAVGRYPGSRLRLCAKGTGGGKRLCYAFKGDAREVVRFFDDRLRQIHRTVIVSGDLEAPAAQTEVFGIHTTGHEVAVIGYSYASQRLSSTAVSVRQSVAPALSEYVEIEVTEE